MLRLIASSKLVHMLAETIDNFFKIYFILLFFFKENQKEKEQHVLKRAMCPNT